MTDLTDVLPDFDLTPWRHLMFSLEKKDVKVAELLSIDPVEIVRRCPLPLVDLRKLVNAIIQALHSNLKVQETHGDEAAGGVHPVGNTSEGSQESKQRLPQKGVCVKTLDPRIDGVLGGGFYAKHITEIVGESATGKTQFVLSLLLSAQLPIPQGLGRSVMYISTEAPLKTQRLAQMLDSNPAYTSLPTEQRPSLDRVHAISTNDLELQEHIIRFQLPVAVKKFDIGLVVMDSVAANFRAEHETVSRKGLINRAKDLIRLGAILRRIASEHNVAVVVTNQVSDRFEEVKPPAEWLRSSSPVTASSPSQPSRRQLPSSVLQSRRSELSTLDFQQRFFTGWGDRAHRSSEQLKTPTMGLTWANQISARVVLKMESERHGDLPSEYLGGNIWKDKKKKRFLQVVFAPWAEPMAEPLSYEIQASGIVSVGEPKGEATGNMTDSNEIAELLDPTYWTDNSDREEEFP